MKSILIILTLFFATVSSAASGDGVLVPVFYGGPGLQGSIWRTRLTVLNDSDKPLQGIYLWVSCPIPEGCPIAFPARASWVAVAEGYPRYSLGFFLFPEAVDAEVSYALRVYDANGSDANYGTDIPVVPIADFSTRKLQMLDVPRDPTSRVTLRIYAIPPAQPRVRVRIYEDPPLPAWFDDTVLPPRLLSESFYDLQPSPDFAEKASFSQPSGLVVSDVLASLPESAPRTVRVEVETTDSSSPIWAFASTTNNATQLVTTIVPRMHF